MPELLPSDAPTFTVKLTADELDCVLWAMSDREEPEDGDWNPDFLTAMDKLENATREER